jgi:hypothetical protein
MVIFFTTVTVLLMLSVTVRVTVTGPGVGKVNVGSFKVEAWLSLVAHA